MAMKYEHIQYKSTCKKPTAILKREKFGTAGSKVKR